MQSLLRLSLLFSMALRVTRCLGSRLVSSRTTPLPTLRTDLRPKVIFVLGGPGAGKGTQCERLARDFGMSHLSAGELLRKERESGSPDGELIENCIRNGVIVPVRITLSLLKRALETSACSRFLVDGFPRNADNLQGWDATMTGVCDVETMIFIEVGEDELERRLLSRGMTSGRSDDNIEAAKKRFVTFREANMPVVNHFEAQNKLVRIAGHGTIDAVYTSIVSSLRPLFADEVLQLTHLLVNAISANDWSQYCAMCDPQATFVGPDTKFNLVEGLEQHRRFFENPFQGPQSGSFGRPSSIQDVSATH